MDFRILGPLEVVTEGGVVDLRGRKQRALLALLLLEVNRPVSQDRLIDALWEDEPTATAPKALQVYVSQLRKQLGHDRVLTEPAGYLLRAGPDELDLSRFKELHAAGKVDEALALWRGPPLAEFGGRRFAQVEIARLEELHLTCLESRLEADVGAGRHADVVAELEALVQRHPLRERLRRLHVLALYRCGRQADALDAYQDARRILVDELGIEPGKELRELQQAILRQDPFLEPAPAEPARGAFVGRDHELSELLAGIDHAIAGRGRLFVLVGEPGIGKSRLAEETIRSARTRGFVVLVGRCWEAGGAPAYWPWVQSLREYGGDTPVELGALLRGEPAPRDSDGARFRLFDATAVFLREASRKRPMLVFLDDMHAADEPSLLLLRFVARELGRARVLFVVACRDVDPVPDRVLAETLAELSREPVTTRLSLGGLNEDDVAAYVESTAAGLASPQLLAKLYEETEGNPLFLSETVRLLAVEERIAIPHSVRDAIARRLSHLSEGCNRVLVLASVLGREFSLGALSAMGETPEREVLELLDEAMTAHVVAEVPGGTRRLRFAHVLIRDTLYEGLTVARRVMLHRLAVETLEQVQGELAELASHAIAGQDLAKGVEYARRAGDRALAVLAFEEAARLFELGLTVVGDDAPGRCGLLLSLGEAQIRAGDSSASRCSFLAAAELAREIGLPVELARAALGYAGKIVWARPGDDERLVPLLEEAVETLGKADVALRARLLARLAGALRDDPDRTRRDQLSREAVELARRVGDPAVLAYTLVGRAHAIVAPDTLEECLPLSVELNEAAAQTGDLEVIVSARMFRNHILVTFGKLADAERELEAAAGAAEELRQPVQLWQVRSSQSSYALAKGLLDEADLMIRDAFELGEHAQPDAALTHYRVQAYTLDDYRGTLDGHEPGLAELVARFPTRPVFRCVLAHYHARVGRRDEAQEGLRDLCRDDALPFDQEWLYATSLLAEVAALLGDTESAAMLYDRLLTAGALNAVDPAEGFAGSVARYLGLLAATLERWNDAARHFEDALRANEAMGVRPLLARTQQEYAPILRRRGADERAAAIEAAAAATLIEIGAAPPN